MKASSMTSKKAVPDKFSGLFDNDWVNHKSTLRTKLNDDRSYDTTYSWDAKADNPQSFSRLQATDMPVQTTKPITLSGKQVILLEKSGNPEIFSSSDIPKDSRIPLTQVQRDLGMNLDLSGKIPFVEEAYKAGKEVVLVAPQGFKNNIATPAVFTIIDKPASLRAAGPQCDQKLLTPTQRREIQEFEIKKRAADEIIGRAMDTREKVKDQLSGGGFRRGIKGVDSSQNENSEIYGERARKEREDKEHREYVHQERNINLAMKTSSMLTNGNILVPESVGSHIRSEKWSQTKGGQFHALTFDETKERLFMRKEMQVDPVRMQALRDMDLGGKQYNLVTHAAIAIHPSTRFDRVNKVLAHPSQASLEGPRNLQGSLRPF